MIRLIKAIVIGFSFVIPGLCSATTAIILKEYENMLEVIGNFYKLKIIKKHIVLIIGITIGVIIGLFLLMLFFERYLLMILIIFLSLNLYNFKIKEIKLNKIILNLVGFFTVYFFTNVLVEVDKDVTLLYILYGFVVALGFVLPGLSGSLIMLNLGVYNLIFNLIASKDFLNKLIFIFALGLVFGVLLWSKIFRKLIIDDNKIFKEIIKGMVFGSIYLLIENIYSCINSISDLVVALLLMFICLFTIKYCEKYLRKK